MSHALRRSSSHMRLIDVGANLTDLVYQGSYHGKQKHPVG